jgi:MFS family permease
MPPLTPKPFAFWAVFAALCVACLLSALDLVRSLVLFSKLITRPPCQQLCQPSFRISKGNNLYGLDVSPLSVHCPSSSSIAAYTLTSTALMPISGPLANVFGRRPMMIAALLIFMLGSGLAGGAKHVVSMNMMIAARAVQGAGGGLILALSEIVISA